MDHCTGQSLPACLFTKMPNQSPNAESSDRTSKKKIPLVDRLFFLYSHLALPHGRAKDYFQEDAMTSIRKFLYCDGDDGCGVWLCGMQQR